MWTEKIKRNLGARTELTYKQFCDGSTKTANMSVGKVFVKQFSVVCFCVQDS